MPGSTEVGLTEMLINSLLTFLCASHISSSSQGRKSAIVVTLFQSYFLQSFGFVVNMRNSLPCGLAIGSQRASSSQGHLPLTRDEKLNKTTRSTAKDLAAITVRKHQPSVMEGLGDWKQGNSEIVVSRVYQVIIA